MNIDLWSGKILQLGSRRTLRNVHMAIELLSKRLNERAVAIVSVIICLPPAHKDLDMVACSFETSGAVLIFQDPDSDDHEEQNTVLHELAHLLDPGWEHPKLLKALKKDGFKKNDEWRKDPFEAFAEIAAHLILDGGKTRTCTHAMKVVREALEWEN